MNDDKAMIAFVFSCICFLLMFFVVGSYVEKKATLDCMDIHKIKPAAEIVALCGRFK